MYFSVYFNLASNLILTTLPSKELRPVSFLNKSSAVAKMGDRLATIDMGRKVEAAVPLAVGEAGFPSNTTWPWSKPPY